MARWRLDIPIYLPSPSWWVDWKNEWDAEVRHGSGWRMEAVTSAWTIRPTLSSRAVPDSNCCGETCLFLVVQTGVSSWATALLGLSETRKQQAVPGQHSPYWPHWAASLQDRDFPCSRTLIDTGSPGGNNNTSIARVCCLPHVCVQALA